MVVGGGRGEAGGEIAAFGPVAVFVGVLRGMWVLECEGVGGPDEDGDNGSVTQSLLR